jgi:peptide/nickel transport system substrate-binding protein
VNREGATRRCLLVAGASTVVLMTAAACTAGSSSTNGGGGGTSGSGGTSGGSTKSSATIAVNEGAPANLDFTTTDGAAIPQVLLDNVYQGLVELTDAGKIVPALAKSWKVSSDKKTYTFDLVPNATFSNGDKFTADDVKFSIDRVKSPAWKISIKSNMDVVSSVDVLSPTQVAVHLSTPSNNWLYEMTTRIGAMFDPKAVDNLATKAIGTGPYTVTSFVRDNSVTLSRRNDYWGPQPPLQTVKFDYPSDTTTQASGLLSGSIDAIDELPDPNTLSQFKSNPNVTTTIGSTTGKWTLSMNNSKGLFKSKLVRQAVNYAIDRKALVKAVADGYGKVTGSFVPPTDPWYKDLSGDYPYDPAKAKELLKQAGASNASFTFDVPTVPTASAAAQVIKSDLAQVGLTANIKTMSFPAQWLDTVFTKADYDMSIIDHVESHDLAIYGNPKYYFRYDNPKVQQLLKAGDAGTPQQQVADLSQVMQILSDDAVCDWLFLADNINVVSKGLTGLPKNVVAEGLDITRLSWS